MPGEFLKKHDVLVDVFVKPIFILRTRGCHVSLFNRPLLAPYAERRGGMGAPAGIKSNMYWLMGAIDMKSQHRDFQFFGLMFSNKINL